MANLFSLTVPLLIRYPDGNRHVMIACLEHPEGLVYFRPFWNSTPDAKDIQQVKGEVTGEGPWKIDGAVITVLGCQGTNPEEATEFSRWKFHLEQSGLEYPRHEELQLVARNAGLLP